jgi:hypothetical protein
MCPFSQLLVHDFVVCTSNHTWFKTLSLMLILLMGIWIMWKWAMLPTFYRNGVPPSSGSKWLGWVSIPLIICTGSDWAVAPPTLPPLTCLTQFDPEDGSRICLVGYMFTIIWLPSENYSVSKIFCTEKY